MKVNKDDISSIHDYLEGELSDEEKSLLESKISQSTDFANQVSFQKRVMSQFEEIKKNDLKKEMLSNYRSVKKKKHSFILRPVLFAAAAISIIIAAILWQFYPEQNEIVFSRYYQPYDGVSIKRGNDVSVEKWISAYDTEQYKNALDILLNNPVSDITEGQRYLLIGNCYLNLAQTDSSLIWFNKISKNESTIIRDNRDWYIALALLKKGEISKSKEVLQQLENSDTVFGENATELLMEDIFN